MPIDPSREKELTEQVERTFAELEVASKRGGAGILDVLQVYGGLDVAMRQAEEYLSLLNPPPPTFSTTSTSNIES
jgi:hypothetical protein